MHGFGRTIDNQGRCQIGFWKEEKGLSLPNGNWAMYFKDGREECPEGVYMGNQKQWNRLVKIEKIRSFAKNTTPTLTFGQRLAEMFGGPCAMCAGPSASTIDPRQQSRERLPPEIMKSNKF